MCTNTQRTRIYSEMYGRNGVDFIAVSDEKKLSGLCALMLDPDVVVHLLIVAIKAHTIHKCQILARAPKTSRFHIWAISFFNRSLKKLSGRVGARFYLACSATHLDTVNNEHTFLTPDARCTTHDGEGGTILY